MLIKVDGYLRESSLEHDTFIPQSLLRSEYRGFVKHNFREAFPEHLCKVFGFRYTDSDWGTRFDLVIDTDVDRFYRPSYGDNDSSGDTSKIRQKIDPWFKELVEKDINDYDVEDLRRCLKERINFEEVLSKAVELIYNQPTAGFLFEGELLVVMICLENQIWEVRKDLLKTVIEVCSNDLSFLKERELKRVTEWKDKIKKDAEI